MVYIKTTHTLIGALSFTVMVLLLSVTMKPEMNVYASKQVQSTDRLRQSSYTLEQTTATSYCQNESERGEDPELEEISKSVQEIETNAYEEKAETTRKEDSTSETTRTTKNIVEKTTSTSQEVTETETKPKEQVEVGTTASTEKRVEETTTASSSKSKKSEAKYTAAQFRYDGTYTTMGWRWTYYSQNVLPGGDLEIPGRHVDENGYICDENDYICIASDDLAKGTIVDTPFGKQGKIYDCGSGHGTLDVYTNF